MKAKENPGHRHHWITEVPVFEDGLCICHGRCACGATRDFSGDMLTAQQWKGKYTKVRDTQKRKKRRRRIKPKRRGS